MIGVVWCSNGVNLKMKCIKIKGLRIFCDITDIPTTSTRRRHTSGKKMLENAVFIRVYSIFGT